MIDFAKNLDFGTPIAPPPTTSQQKSRFEKSGVKSRCFAWFPSLMDQKRILENSTPQQAASMKQKLQNQRIEYLSQPKHPSKMGGLYEQSEPVSFAVVTRGSQKP